MKLFNEVYIIEEIEYIKEKFAIKSEMKAKQVLKVLKNRDRTISYLEIKLLKSLETLVSTHKDGSSKKLMFKKVKFLRQCTENKVFATKVEADEHIELILDVVEL